MAFKQGTQRVILGRVGLGGEDISGGDVGFLKILDNGAVEQDRPTGKVEGLLNTAAQHDEARHIKPRCKAREGG